MPKYEDQFKMLWSGSQYNAGGYGTNILTSMGFTKKDFEFPKSIYTVKDCVFAVSDKDSIVLDFFAGSGTTGQSVMMLNAEDGGNRKYILVEMGEYFAKVTLPRIKKVVYSAEWKDGKPKNRTSGVSHIMKYLSLESYEDALSNIELKTLGRTLNSTEYEGLNEVGTLFSATILPYPEPQNHQRRSARI